MSRLREDGALLEQTRKLEAVRCFYLGIFYLLALEIDYTAVADVAFSPAVLMFLSPPVLYKIQNKN